MILSPEEGVGERIDLLERLVTFPASFPFDFAYGRLAGKVTIGNHMTDY